MGQLPSSHGPIGLFSSAQATPPSPLPAWAEQAHLPACSPCGPRGSPSLSLSSRRAGPTRQVRPPPRTVGHGTPAHGGSRARRPSLTPTRPCRRHNYLLRISPRGGVPASPVPGLAVPALLWTPLHGESAISTTPTGTTPTPAAYINPCPPQRPTPRLHNTLRRRIAWGRLRCGLAHAHPPLPPPCPNSPSTRRHPPN